MCDAKRQNKETLVNAPGGVRSPPSRLFCEGVGRGEKVGKSQSKFREKAEAYATSRVLLLCRAASRGGREVTMVEMDGLGCMTV